MAAFCQAPYDTVCGNSQQETDLRTQRIQAVEAALKKPALAAAFQAWKGNTEMPASFSENDFKNIQQRIHEHGLANISFRCVAVDAGFKNIAHSPAKN